MLDTEYDRLHVYFPQGGRRLLLHWYTYHDRGHIIVAATEAALQVVLTRVLKEYPEAHIKDYLDVEVVAPSRALQADYTTSCRQHRVQMFWIRLVNSLIPPYEKRHGRLPPGLMRCETYAPTFDISDPEDPEYEAEKRAEHCSCANCYETVAPVGLTLEEYYEQMKAAVVKLDVTERNVYRSSPPSKEKDPRGESRAVVAEDHDALGAVIASHGHHAAGTHITWLDPAEQKTHGNWLRSWPVLLFFRDAKPRDSAAFVQMAVDAMAAQKRKQNAKRMQQIADNDAREAKRLFNIEKLFAS